MATRASVAATRQLAPAVHEWSLTLVEPSTVRFRAGQYLSLGCGDDERGLSQRRAYSIASSPADPSRLLICAKLIPGGFGSRYLNSLEVGDEVSFTGPMGMFVLEFEHPGDVVFGATGTGIAPVLPMLEELLGRPEGGRVILFWGLRSEEDLFYEDRLAALSRQGGRLEAHVCLSRSGDGWQGDRGRITSHLLGALPELREPVFYLVGNGAMIDELKSELRSRDVNVRRRVRTEAYFEAPTAAAE